jgi:hypothetical protein
MLYAFSTLAIALLGLDRFMLSAPPAPTPQQIRAAVARSLPLLEKSCTEYTAQRECFSCHHQALPLLGLTIARSHGFAVRAEVVQKQLQFTVDSLAKNREKYRQGRGQGGQADTAGYALLALELGGWKPDETTSAVAEYLLLRDKDSNHWQVTSRRPPSEASSFTTTYLALRSLQTFASQEQAERRTARIKQIRRWLSATPAKDTEDRVFRLGALQLAGAGDQDLRAAVQDLVQTQQKNGGWAQTADLAADAYATGSALVVLHQAGGMPVNDSVYQRGLAFLVAAQQADGSWLVHSRSKPFQTYFESSFPHGKDQFISIAASGWATAALALACPPTKKGVRNRFVPLSPGFHCELCGTKRFLTPFFVGPPALSPTSPDSER